MDVKNTISREEVEALEQWARQRATYYEGQPAAQAYHDVIALCETVRAQQKREQARRFDMKEDSVLALMQQRDAAVARAEQAERERDQLRDQLQLADRVIESNEKGVFCTHCGDGLVNDGDDNWCWVCVGNLKSERDAARAEVKRLSEGIMQCIDASWSGTRSLDWTRPELILAEYVGDVQAEVAQARAELRDETAENLSLRSRLVDGDPQILDDITKVRAARDEWLAKHAACVAELEEHEATIATLREQLTSTQQILRDAYAEAAAAGTWVEADLPTMVRSLVQQVTTLREQLQAAQADTERMDWLDGLADRTEYQNKRVGHRPVSSDMHFDYGRARLYVRNQEGRVVVSGEGTVREAIDAARVKQAHPTPAQEGQ